MERPDPNDPDPSEHAEPIVVGTYPTVGEAEVAQAKLRDAGIESVVDDQIEGGTVPVDGEPGISLVVRAADAEPAGRLLADGRRND